MRIAAFAIAAMVATDAASTAVLADGALYVAVPKSSLRDGFAYGLSYDDPTMREAQEGALQKCNEKAKEHGVNATCTLEGTFRRRCAAVAMDGTNRWAGWGIGDTKDVASRLALTECSKGAPSCEVTDVVCDTK